jgi:hypothetical protein
VIASIVRIKCLFSCFFSPLTLLESEADFHPLLARELPIHIRLQQGLLDAKCHVKLSFHSCDFFIVLFLLFSSFTVEQSSPFSNQRPTFIHSSYVSFPSSSVSALCNLVRARPKSSGVPDAIAPALFSVMRQLRKRRHETVPQVENGTQHAWKGTEGQTANGSRAVSGLFSLMGQLVEKRRRKNDLSTDRGWSLQMDGMICAKTSLFMSAHRSASGTGKRSKQTWAEDLGLTQYIDGSPFRTSPRCARRKVSAAERSLNPSPRTKANGEFLACPAIDPACNR